MKLRARKLNFIDVLVIFAYTASVLLFSYREEASGLGKLAALGLAAVAGLHFLRGARGIIVPREFLFFALWLVIAMISVFFAIEQATGFKKAITLLQLIPVSFTLYLLLIWNRSIAPLVWSFVAALTVVAFITVRHPEIYSSGGRLVGTLGNANMLGLALVIGVAFVVHLAATSRSKVVEICCYLLGAWFFLVLLETGSRKAIVGVIVVMLMMAFYPVASMRRLSVLRRTGALASGLMLLVVAGYFIVHSAHYNRIDRMVQAVESSDLETAGKSEKDRLLMYKHAFAIALHHPLLGVGLDNFRHTEMGGFGGSVGTYSHSNYLEIVVSTGFLGLLIYYAAYASIGWRLFNLRRKWEGAEGAALWRTLVTLLIIMILYDFAAVSYYEKTSWLALVVLISGLRILDLSSKEGGADSARLESDAASPSVPGHGDRGLKAQHGGQRGPAPTR